MGEKDNIGLEEIDSIKNMMDFPKGEPEMSYFESSFLCEIIKKYKPHKIVEVGIAGGGTSAIISACINGLGDDTVEFYSVDYSERFYRDSKYESGYLGKKADELLEIKFKHKYCLGNIAYSFKKDIGYDIDLLILDTMHSLPGEVLDFVSLLPQLKNGCVVVLHDIALNLLSDARDKFATGVLYSVVSGKKIYKYDATKEDGCANIGAFIVDESTRENVEDLFFSMMLTWNYIPDCAQIALYKECISKSYNKKLYELFCNIIDWQNESKNKANSVKNRLKNIVRAIIRKR